MTMLIGSFKMKTLKYVPVFIATYSPERASPPVILLKITWVLVLPFQYDL